MKHFSLSRFVISVITRSMLLTTSLRVQNNNNNNNINNNNFRPTKPTVVINHRRQLEESVFDRWGEIGGWVSTVDFFFPLSPFPLSLGSGTRLSMKVYN